MKLTNYERFEILAEAFRVMTGHMAPGKDPSMHSYPAPYEERRAAWDTWNAQHLDVVRAVLTASERVIQREETCTTCNGSGWVTRDPDIGTDRECSVCDGNGRVSDA